MDLFGILAKIVQDLAVLVDDMGQFGVAIINIFLSVVNWELPEKIIFGDLVLNTSMFFDVLILIAGVYGISKFFPDFFARYIKHITFGTILVIGLAILSNFI